MNWDTVGSIGTAIAVLIAAWQVRRNTQQATTDFEDDLSREYRELARAIPMEAHLGGELADVDFEAVLPRLFQYIDLSNQQVFLRQAGRISRSTWEQWNAGIQATLELPAFARAWKHVKAKASNRFGELRRIEVSSFSEDPRSWLSFGQRVRQYWSA